MAIIHTRRRLYWYLTRTCEIYRCKRQKQKTREQTKIKNLKFISLALDVINIDVSIVKSHGKSHGIKLRKIQRGYLLIEQVSGHFNTCNEAIDVLAIFIYLNRTKKCTKKNLLRVGVCGESFLDSQGYGETRREPIRP